MPCTPFSINGMKGIICSRGRAPKRCGWCHRVHVFQCDWKMGTDKTCDRLICDTHAQQVASDKHLCPIHQATYALWLARQKAKATERA